MVRPICHLLCNLEKEKRYCYIPIGERRRRKRRKKREENPIWLEANWTGSSMQFVEMMRWGNLTGDDNTKPEDAKLAPQACHRPRFLALIQRSKWRGFEGARIDSPLPAFTFSP